MVSSSSVCRLRSRRSNSSGLGGMTKRNSASTTTLSQLARPLDLDLEDHRESLAEVGLYLASQRAIEIAVVFCVLEELALVHLAMEFIGIEEVVVLSIHLTRSSRACRRGYRHDDGFIFEQAFADRGLARTRGARDDNETTCALVGVAGQAHSRF